MKPLNDDEIILPNFAIHEKADPLNINFNLIEVRALLDLGNGELCADAYYVDKTNTGRLIEKKGKDLIHGIKQLEATYKALVRKNYKVDHIYLIHKRIPKEATGRFKFVTNKQVNQKTLRTLPTHAEYKIGGLPVFGLQCY